MIGKLRDLFKKEEPEEEIHTNYKDLGNLLKKERSKFKEDIEKEIKEKTKELKNEFTRLEGYINELRTAQHEGNVDARLKSVANSNRDALIRKFEVFKLDTKFPDEINFEDYLEFSRKTLNRLDKVMQRSEKNIFLSNKLFKKQVGNILQEIENIKQTAGNLQSYLKEKENKFERIKSSEKILGELHNLYEEIESEDRRNEIKKQRDSIEKEIRNLKYTTEYKNLQENLEQRKKLNKKLRGLEDKITQLFSPLEKPLKKLKYDSPGDELLGLYISNPIKAFKKDKGLQNLNVYLKEIEGQSLTLEKKKRQKIQNQIELIRKSDLKSIKKDMEELNKNLNNKPDKTIQNKIEKKEKEKNKVEGKIKKEEKRIKEKENKKQEFHNKIKDLEYELKKLLGKEVNISPPEI